MTKQSHPAKTFFLIGVIVIILLNLYTFTIAYPETYTPSPGINTSGSILAKDFSAYYVSAWRMWTNPSQTYHFGALGGGEPVTLPYPQAYKYLPSFLLFISPLLSLDYQQALLAFDIVQFMLLPAIAYILYELLSAKNLGLTFVVITISLLVPFPTSNWGLSPSYYWQWGEGQAKVFVTFLLLLSFYLGKKNKPICSGVTFAFGFFDPRFGLLAIPLYIMYNHKRLKLATLSGISALITSNLMLLYPGIGSGFVNMVFGSGIPTPLYYYSLIPFLTLISLIMINFKEIIAVFDYKKRFQQFTGVSK